MGLPLAESDERNRFGIQLYHRVATQADLSGKQVLEVSCGHGGGASYLARTLHPASYTGLDFNPDGIAFCQKRHHVPGLDFMHGDAENLPFADESFDAVVNVEASHAYPRLPRFLAEVVRVLRPGGHFLYADFRGRSEFPGWDAALADTQLRAGFGTRHQSGGPARAGEKLAAVNRVDRSPGAGASAPLRPPFRRCARHRTLQRYRKRKDRVPDVLVHQGLSLPRTPSSRNCVVRQRESLLFLDGATHRRRPEERRFSCRCGSNQYDRELRSCRAQTPNLRAAWSSGPGSGRWPVR